MANRLWSRLLTIGRNKVLLDGRFNPAGVGAITDVVGVGLTVARTGVGTFEVTLSDAYAAVESAQAHLQLLNPADSFAQLGSYTAATRKLVIRTLTAGVVADIAADPHNIVHFQIVVKNTG